MTAAARTARRGCMVVDPQRASMGIPPALAAVAHAACPQGQFVTVVPAISSHLVLQYLLPSSAWHLQAG